MAAAGPASPETYLPGDEAEISNDFFRIRFDRRKGIFSVYRKNGTALVSAATARVNAGMEGSPIILNHHPYAISSLPFTDTLGSGKKLVIHAKDPAKKIDLDIFLALYDQLEALTIEAICRNSSANDIFIHSIEPIRVIRREGGSLQMPGVAKCITNGQMYFDAGTLHVFGEKAPPLSSEGIKNIHFANASLDDQQETIRSWWNIGLFGEENNESIVLGYLENTECLGSLAVARSAPGEISFVAESMYLPGLILHPGKTVSSNRLILNLAANPYRALEQYAAALGKAGNARTRSVINGWCSWFYTLTSVSEEEVLANAAFAAKHLKPYGLQYIQVDEGYQRWHGDWEGNARFPHGMKWLAGQIRSQGFKAGLWISPYVISEPTEIFQKHREWLVRNPDGSPQRVGNWSEPPAEENPRRYCLDITHPEAAQWLYELIDRIVHGWGFEMIKIDFVAWSLLSANRFFDPSLSAAQVYRKGMEIIRRAAGEQCHILECGPGNITVGLVDSMRIEWDVNYGFSEAAWDTYFTHPAGSAAAAGRRYYFHRRTWINDADHLCMDLLNNRQSEAAATLIGLSGGNMMSGDRLTQLDPYKLEILRKITPSYGEAAIPVDLLDAEIPSVFALKIKKTFAEWTVLGLFNHSLTETNAIECRMERLGLDPTKKYLAFDFWNEAFAGGFSGGLSQKVEPGSVRLLALHEKTGRPQFISTSRHILQGAVELDQFSWDEDRKVCSGISVGPPGSSHHVFVYLPEEHPWSWGSSYFLFRDEDSYSLKLVHSQIIRVHISFEHSERVPWEIRYGEFFR